MSDVNTAAAVIKSDERTPYPLRNDTMLGVCAALGDLFGFNPLYIRIAIGSLVIFNLMLAAAVYLGLGVVVFIGHLIFPRRFEAAGTVAVASSSIGANDALAAPEKLAA